MLRRAAANRELHVIGGELADRPAAALELKGRLPGGRGGVVDMERSGAQPSRQQPARLVPLAAAAALLVRVDAVLVLRVVDDGVDAACRVAEAQRVDGPFAIVAPEQRRRFVDASLPRSVMISGAVRLNVVDTDCAGLSIRDGFGIKILV